MTEIKMQSEWTSKIDHLAVQIKLFFLTSTENYGLN